MSLGEEGYTTRTLTKATYSVQAVIIHCTVVSERRKGSAVFRQSSGGSIGDNRRYTYIHIYNIYVYIYIYNYIYTSIDASLRRASLLWRVVDGASAKVL